MPKQAKIFDQIIDFLASVKLALVLLLALAVAAIGGTVVPQNLPHEQYLQGYGPGLYTFLSYLDMFDMYNSWWFTLLLGLLVVNLLVCSARRLPKTARLVKPGDPERIGPDFLERQRFSRTIIVNRPPGDLLLGVKDLFRKNIGPSRERERSWGKLMYGQKGAFSRFGAYVVHASLLFFMAGGLVGGIWGYSARLTLDENETADFVIGQRPAGRIDLPFAVRLDDFIIKFYKNGQPSEFRSQVTVLENGKDVKKADILVNHPLIYRGITIYQSHYGQKPGQKIDVRVTRKSDDKRFNLNLAMRKPAELDDGTVIAWLETADDLMGAGPAAKLIIQPDGQEAYGAWAFLNRPLFVPPNKGPYTFDLKKYEPKYYSGLLVNKDPGVPLIWIGCAVMFIGFLITFLFSHQKLYIGMISENEHTRIILAGTSHRNQGGFKNKFDRLAADLEKLGNGEYNA